MAETLDRNIFLARKRRLLNVWLGLATAAVGVVNLLLAGRTGSVLIGVGLGLALVALWQGRSPLIRLREDHLELQLVPLLARHFVPYAKLVEVSQPRPKQLVVAYVTPEGARKRVTVVLGLLEPEDADYLQALLAEKCASGVTP